MDQSLFACTKCEHDQFRTSIRSEMARHYAAVHGEGVFSTLECRICHKRYYDIGLFKDHAAASRKCKSNLAKVRFFLIAL